MKTNYKILVILISVFISIIGCKKHKYYEGERDNTKIRGYNNQNYYTSGKMDSTAAIYYITNQKLQEVYDLSILAAENKSNKGIDTILLSQIQEYFAKTDTLSTPKIVNELDSLKVKYVKIELNKSVTNDSIILNDSIGKVDFKINYYDKSKRFLSVQLKQANYILKKNPKKFKAEFKFYFSTIENFNNPEGEIK